MSSLSLDLNKEYNRLNEELFNSELPNDIPVIWTKARKFDGVTSAIFDTDNNDFLSATIRINRFFDSNQNETINTLIHEMIHIKQALKGGCFYRNESHGISFVDEMNRINRDFPQYNISKSNKDYRTIRKDYIQEQHGFAVYLRDGRRFFNLFKEKISRDLFILILQCFKCNPEFDGAFVFTFNGHYDMTGHSITRRKESSLIRDLQIPHKKLGNRLFHTAEKDMDFRYRLENETTHFILKKENAFSWAVYPELHGEEDKLDLELLKIYFEVGK